MGNGPGGCMRCSLCEKNDCPTGVVCPACEAHYATIREGHLRRQALRVGEAELAHVAWSLHAATGSRSKGQDPSRPWWSSWWGKRQPAPVEAPEESPPPPDWKNRVRPAPDGLPPALEDQAPQATPPKPEALVAGPEGGEGSGAQSGPSLPVEVTAPAEVEDQGPVAEPPMVGALDPQSPSGTALGEAPVLKPATEGPTLASFFEGLAAAPEAAEAPSSARPAPSEDVASVMNGFLASLQAPKPDEDGPQAPGQSSVPAQESTWHPAPPPTDEADSPPSAQGESPLEPAAQEALTPEATPPEVDLSAWAQWGQEALAAKDEAPVVANTEAAWDALPTLNWEAPTGTRVEAPTPEPPWGAWSPEGQAEDAQAAPAGHQQGESQPALPQGVREEEGHQEPEAPAELNDFFQSLSQAQAATPGPAADPLAGFFAELGEAAPPPPAGQVAPPRQATEAQGLSWQLDQVFASMTQAAGEAAPPTGLEVQAFRKDPLGPLLDASQDQPRKALPKGHQPFTIDLGTPLAQEEPSFPAAQHPPKARLEDPKDGAFSFVLDLSDEGSSRLLEGIEFFGKQGKPEEPGFHFHRNRPDDDPEEGRTIDLS